MEGRAEGKVRKERHEECGRVVMLRGKTIKRWKEMYVEAEEEER